MNATAETFEFAFTLREALNEYFPGTPFNVVIRDECDDLPAGLTLSWNDGPIVDVVDILIDLHLAGYPHGVPARCDKGAMIARRGTTARA